MSATGREPELAIHLRFALRQGWTEDELSEVLLHLSGYIGLPLVRGIHAGGEARVRRDPRRAESLRRATQ